MLDAIIYLHFMIYKNECAGGTFVNIACIHITWVHGNSGKLWGT